MIGRRPRNIEPEQACAHRDRTGNHPPSWRRCGGCGNRCRPGSRYAACGRYCRPHRRERRRRRPAPLSTPGDSLNRLREHPQKRRSQSQVGRGVDGSCCSWTGCSAPTLQGNGSRRRLRSCPESPGRGGLNGSRCRPDFSGGCCFSDRSRPESPHGRRRTSLFGPYPRARRSSGCEACDRRCNPGR